MFQFHVFIPLLFIKFTANELVKMNLPEKMFWPNIYGILLYNST